MHLGIYHRNSKYHSTSQYHGIIKARRDLGGLRFSVLQIQSRKKSAVKAEPAVRSDQVAQGFIQLGLENLQLWKLTAQSLWATCSTAWRYGSMADVKASPQADF